MRRVGGRIAAGLLTLVVPASFTANPRFEKLSDHCYFLQSPYGGPNTGAVVTTGGVLLINPPAQPDLATALEALKRLTSKPVTWVVNTDFKLGASGGSAHLSTLDAVVITSDEQRKLAIAAKTQVSNSAVSPRDENPASPAISKSEAELRYRFARQMRLFPDNLEIRIAALSTKSLTSGDIVVFVPTEKVLYLGGLFLAGKFPEIDPKDDGSALGWIDGIRRVVEMVPLLKSAMPPPKPNPAKPQPEPKTLEELVTVIPGAGGRSNLQDLKDLLEAAHRLRNEISKAVAAGKSRESFLFQGSVNQYHGYPNFENFALQLYDELSTQKK